MLLLLCATVFCHVVQQKSINHSHLDSVAVHYWLLKVNFESKLIGADQRSPPSAASFGRIGHVRTYVIWHNYVPFFLLCCCYSSSLNSLAMSAECPWAEQASASNRADLWPRAKVKTLAQALSLILKINQLQGRSLAYIYISQPQRH